MRDEMDNLIRIAAFRIAHGQTRREVRDFLLKEGLTEEQAYLAYVAAKILSK